MRRADERRLRCVRARFGLQVCAAPDHDARARVLEDAASTLSSRLAPGGVALITGPSGSGKSVLLRAFVAQTGAVAATPVSPAARRPAVALIRRDLETTLAVLAAAGLGEARRMVTPAGRLSDGERARLALAHAIAHARERDIACDEFTCSLDRLTARSLCRCVRRTLQPTQRLVVATAHDDVAPMLDPDLVVYVPLLGPPVLMCREGEDADACHPGVA